MVKDSSDRLEMDGIVISSCRSIFEVQIEGQNSFVVQATLSGKIRQSQIRIIVGDKVRVDLGLYDLSKGRIIYRYNKISK